MRGEPQGRGTLPSRPVFNGAEDAGAGADARWETSEPTFATVLGRFRRAMAKSRRRSSWMIVSFVAGALLLVVVLRNRKPVHTAQVTFRVKDDGNASLQATDAQMRDAVKLNYFTHGNLLAIIEEYKLYQAMRARAPYLAVESFRDDIRVDASRAEASGDGEGAHLRVKITFEHADGLIAKAVAADLAELVVSGSRSALAARHVFALEHASGVAEAVFRNSSRAYRPVTRASKSAEPGRAKQLEEPLLEALRDRTAVQLRAAEDLADHKIAFEIIDADVRIRGAPLTLGLASAVAIAVAAAVVAMGALLLGAGTAFVMDETDLLALHLPPLGSLPVLGSQK